jgi:hypothetical protein
LNGAAGRPFIHDPLDPHLDAASEPEHRWLDQLRDAERLPTKGIFLSPFEQGEIGLDLFHKACEFGLEGLVSKHLVHGNRRCHAHRALKIYDRHNQSNAIDFINNVIARFRSASARFEQTTL